MQYLLIIAVVIALLYTDNNREVVVHICEEGGLTTYVDRYEPPKLLKFGECSTKTMPNHEYYRVKSSFERRRR